MPIVYSEGQYTRRKKDGTGHTLVTKGILDSVARDDATNLEIAEDNTERIIAAMGDAITAGLVEIGMSCERFAKKTCPVDTGRLRNSITWQLAPDENAVYIGTNVEYAFYVHEGLGTNRKKGPRPFLKDAAANHRTYYDGIMKKHMQGS